MFPSRQFIPLASLAGVLLAAPAMSLHPDADADPGELGQLRAYVSDLASRITGLQKLLVESEQRNQRQSQLIERLETRLAECRYTDPSERQQTRRDFFHDLAEQVPLSPVYRVEAEHLLVMADPVFVFGTGQIGAEGESRLQPLAQTLSRLVERLPQQVGWRLRIEGHTDARQIRGNSRFASNWELSAARAVALLRFLRRQGIAADRLYASGFAATRPLSTALTSAAHRRNRRIEVHLELEKRC